MSRVPKRDFSNLTSVGVRAGIDYLMEISRALGRDGLMCARETRLLNCNIPSPARESAFIGQKPYCRVLLAPSSVITTFPVLISHIDV